MKVPIADRRAFVIRRVIRSHEGGYVNHPEDPGGETNFGITKMTYPELDIAALTEDDAVAIYARDFWPEWLDWITDTETVEYFFRGAINIRGGFRTVVKCAQRAFNDLDQRNNGANGVSLDWRLKVDGFYGPKTSEALESVFEFQTRDLEHIDDPMDVESLMLGDLMLYSRFHLRMRRHLSFVYLAVSGVRHPFLKGWLDRALGE